MGLPNRIKRHRYPSFIVSHAIWMYHRFNLSYRDIQEELAFRGGDSQSRIHSILVLKVCPSLQRSHLKKRAQADRQVALR